MRWMVGVKLCSAVDSQMIKTMLGKSFSDANTTEKHYWQQCLFPEVYHFEFSNCIDTIWEIRVNWEKNVNTLTHTAS